MTHWPAVAFFATPPEEDELDSVEIDLDAARSWPPADRDEASPAGANLNVAPSELLGDGIRSDLATFPRPQATVTMAALPDLLPDARDDFLSHAEALLPSSDGEVLDANLDDGPEAPALDQLEMSESGSEPVSAPEAAQPDETVVVKAGDTLFDILTRVGVEKAEAQEVVASLSELYDPRRLQPGQELGVAFLSGDTEAAAQRLLSLSLAVDVGNDVVLARAEDGSFSAQMVERSLSRRVAYGAGEVEGSLYETAQRNGVPLDAVAALVKLFSWDVDFQRDIHTGDGFEALYARLLNDKGEFVRSDELLFAALDMRGRTLAAYRFERDDGTVDYYDGDGRAIRKSLLKTPIDGARLSSQFGPRKHPILGYTRMHKGIDFAASTGTPVFAAGDGTVDFVGRNSGYGKYIRLRHNDDYSTAYGHLSGFQSGLKKGARVRQGDVIGYVGSTGMATGPHLHYEILYAGEQINPLEVKQVVAGELSGNELTRFRTMRDKIDSERGAFQREQLVAQSLETTN